MKKIYTIIAMMLLIGSAYAQNRLNPVKSNIVHVPNMSSIYHDNSLKSVQPMTIAYDTADNYNQTAVLGNSFTSYYDILNYSYMAGIDTFSSKYFVVAVDTLVDPYIITAGLNTSYSYSQYPTLHLDSIYVVLQQANSSNTDDTLIVKIMNVNAIGYPGSTILTADTIVIPFGNSIALQSAGVNSFSSAISSYGFPAIPIYFNNNTGYDLTPGNKKFTVQVEYHGDLTDTCGFIMGTPNTGQCGSLSIVNAIASSYPGGTPSATHVSANSFSYELYPALSGLDPNASGQEFWYYDCNGDGTHDAGDGMEVTQNWDIYIYLDGTTGIQENKSLGIKLAQNVPNPFNNTTDITYQLAKRTGNVTLEITDLTGRVVSSINEGAKDAGKYTITLDSKNLSQGAYFYTLNVDGYRLTNKMLITK